MSEKESFDQKIDQISKHFGIKPLDIKESVIDDILENKYHRLEVINIRKRGKAGKFAREDMAPFTTDDLRHLASKYAKNPLPPGLSRDSIISSLLGKLKGDKLSDTEAKRIGRFERPALAGALGIYAGWIPKVKKKLSESDIKRGKVRAKWYNKKK